MEVELFDRILIPLDGSPNSEKIKHWVVELAAALESSVDLLAVIDPTKLQPQKHTADSVVQSAEDLIEVDTWLVAPGA